MRSLPLALFAIIITATCLADDGDLLTPEQIRNRAERAEQKQQQRDERVNPAKPGAAMPASSDPTDAALPQTNKYESQPEPSGAPRTTKPAARRNAASPATAPMQGGGGDVHMDVVKVTRVKYGIRVGTVMHGELRRNISSAETGWAEIFLTQATHGDYLTLPTGTQLFARKRANNSTKRMELTFVHGITPDGEEFDLDGLVYDEQNVAGIPGLVVDKTKEIASAGVNKTILAAGRGALQSLGAGGNIIGRAATEGGSSVINDIGQHEAAQADTGIVIYASPQSVRVRVQKTF